MKTAQSFNLSGFGLPELPIDNKLNRVLTAALKQQTDLRSSVSDNAFLYWQADYFNLGQVSLFQDASTVEQQQILKGLNQSLLQESVYIEQAGVGYMAKMVLMADSTQERMLYGLFAADETTHLAQLRPYVSSHTLLNEPDDPFLQLLSDIVESSDKAVLLFVLQVVLEGWGLTHYRSLARGCTHRPLRDLFQSFLQAESRHHGVGVTLFNQTQVSTDSKESILECLAMFLQMVRVGPQRVVSEIATTKGHLSRPQRIQILQQLDTVGHAHQRLQLLKSLMVSTGNTIVSQLEENDLFTPLSAEEAASYG
ncbi:MAG: ferritin-like domain-containing protein [Cyanobacteria bacterium P01_H01_bin.21]